MKLTGINYGLTHVLDKFDQPLQYYIKLSDDEYPLNSVVGAKLSLTFQDKIQCVHCGRVIKKTFNNGYCYPCFKSLPENDICIVKPNLCHYDNGTCRDEQFAAAHCMKPHYVYLAVSSDVKVGMTRECNSMKRWGDQGAVQAVPIAKLPTRKLAGELELQLMDHYPDKTNWRKMLKGDVPELDLIEVRNQALAYITDDFASHILGEEQPVQFVYPIKQAVTKITSYNLDKAPVIEDTLVGIKGQYLIFEDGVINMKKFAGYQLELSTL